MPLPQDPYRRAAQEQADAEALVAQQQRTAERLANAQAKQAAREQKAAADAARKAELSKQELAMRAKGMIPVTTADGNLHPDPLFEQKQAEKAAKEKRDAEAAQLQLEEQRKARADKARRAALDERIQALETTATDPAQKRLPQKDRVNLVNQVKKVIQENALPALQTSLQERAKAVSGGADWIPFNETATEDAQKAQQHLQRLQNLDPSNPDLTEEDLALLESNAATKPFVDKIRNARAILARDDEAAKFHEQTATRIFDLKLRRDNPAAWAERQRQRRAGMTPEQLAADLESSSADLTARGHSLNDAFAPIQARRTATQQKLDDLRLQAAQRRQQGLTAGEMVTMTNPDGTTETWPADLAAQFEKEQALHQQAEAQDTPILERIIAQRDELLADEALHNEARQQLEQKRVSQQDGIATTLDAAAPGMGAEYRSLLADKEQRASALQTQYAGREDSPEAKAAFKALSDDIAAKASLIEGVAREEATKKTTALNSLWEKFNTFADNRDHLYDWIAKVSTDTDLARAARAKSDALRSSLDYAYGAKNKQPGYSYRQGIDELFDAEAKALGIDPKEARVFMETRRRLDWSRPLTGDAVEAKESLTGPLLERLGITEMQEPLRTLPDGTLLPNPALGSDEAAFRAVIGKSAGTPEQKKAALKLWPEYRRMYGETLLATFADQTAFGEDFTQWREENPMPSADPIEQALAYSDKMKGRPAWRRWGDLIASNVTAGFMDVTSAILGTAGAASGLVNNSASEAISSLAASNAANAGTLVNTQDALSNTGLGGAITGTIARMAPGVAATIATGSMAAAMTFGGMQTTGMLYSEAYGKLREDGMSHEDAWRSAAPASAAAGAMTAALTKVFPGGATAILQNPATRHSVRAMMAGFLASGKSIAKGALDEIPEELIDEGVSQFAQAQAEGRDPRSAVRDFITGLPELIAASGLVGGGMQAVSDYRNKQPSSSAPSSIPPAWAAIENHTTPRAKSISTASASASVATDATGQVDQVLTEQQQRRAALALSLAQGGELFDVEAADLAAAGWTRDGDKFKPLKDYTGPQVLDIDSGGLPVIKDSYIAALRQTGLAPVADAIGMTETQTRNFYAQRNNPTTPDQNTPAGSQQPQQTGGAPAPAGSRPDANPSPVQAPAGAGNEPARSGSAPAPSGNALTQELAAAQQRVDAEQAKFGTADFDTHRNGQALRDLAAVQKKIAKAQQEALIAAGRALSSPVQAPAGAGNEPARSGSAPAPSGNAVSDAGTPARNDAAAPATVADTLANHLAERGLERPAAAAAAEEIAARPEFDGMSYEQIIAEGPKFRAALDDLGIAGSLHSKHTATDPLRIQPGGRLEKVKAEMEAKAEAAKAAADPFAVNDVTPVNQVPSPDFATLRQQLKNREISDRDASRQVAEAVGATTPEALMAAVQQHLGWKPLRAEIAAHSHFGTKDQSSIPMASAGRASNRAVNQVNQVTPVNQVSRHGPDISLAADPSPLRKNRAYAADKLRVLAGIKDPSKKAWARQFLTALEQSLQRHHTLYDAYAVGGPARRHLDGQMTAVLEVEGKITRLIDLDAMVAQFDYLQSPQDALRATSIEEDIHAAVLQLARENPQEYGYAALRQKWQALPDVLKQTVWTAYRAANQNTTRASEARMPKLTAAQEWHMMNEFLRMLVQDASFAGAITETVDPASGLIGWVQDLLKNLSRLLKNLMKKVQPDLRANLDRMVFQISDRLAQIEQASAAQKDRLAVLPSLRDPAAYATTVLQQLGTAENAGILSDAALARVFDQLDPSLQSRAFALWKSEAGTPARKAPKHALLRSLLAQFLGSRADSQRLATALAGMQSPPKTTGLLTKIMDRLLDRVQAPEVLDLIAAQSPKARRDLKNLHIATLRAIGGIRAASFVHDLGTKPGLVNALEAAPVNPVTEVNNVTSETAERRRADFLAALAAREQDHEDARNDENQLKLRQRLFAEESVNPVNDVSEVLSEASRIQSRLADFLAALDERDRQIELDHRDASTPAAGPALRRKLRQEEMARAHQIAYARGEAIAEIQLLTDQRRLPEPTKRLLFDLMKVAAGRFEPENQKTTSWKLAGYATEQTLQRLGLRISPQGYLLTIDPVNTVAYVERRHVIIRQDTLDTVADLVPAVAAYLHLRLGSEYDQRQKHGLPTFAKPEPQTTDDVDPPSLSDSPATPERLAPESLSDSPAFTPLAEGQSPFAANVAPVSQSPSLPVSPSPAPTARIPLGGRNSLPAQFATAEDLAAFQYQLDRDALLREGTPEKDRNAARDRITALRARLIDETGASKEEVEQKLADYHRAVIDAAKKADPVEVFRPVSFSNFLRARGTQAKADTLVAPEGGDLISALQGRVKRIGKISQSKNAGEWDWYRQLQQQVQAENAGRPLSRRQLQQAQKAAQNGDVSTPLNLLQWINLNVVDADKGMPIDEAATALSDTGKLDENDPNAQQPFDVDGTSLGEAILAAIDARVALRDQGGDPALRQEAEAIRQGSDFRAVAEGAPGRAFTGSELAARLQPGDEIQLGTEWLTVTDVDTEEGTVALDSDRYGPQGLEPSQTIHLLAIGDEQFPASQSQSLPVSKSPSLDEARAELRAALLEAGIQPLSASNRWTPAKLREEIAKYAFPRPRMEGNRSWLMPDGRWMNVGEHDNAFPPDMPDAIVWGYDQMHAAGFVRVAYIPSIKALHAEFHSARLTNAQRRELKNTAVERGAELHLDPQTPGKLAAAQRQPTIADDEGDTPNAKVAFFGEDHIRYALDSRGTIHILGIYAEQQGQGNGRRMVSWLKNSFPTNRLVADEVALDATGFWDRMQDDGLIDDWTESPFKRKTVPLPQSPRLPVSSSPSLASSPRIRAAAATYADRAFTERGKRTFPDFLAFVAGDLPDFFPYLKTPHLRSAWNTLMAEKGLPEVTAAEEATALRPYAPKVERRFGEPPPDLARKLAAINEDDMGFPISVNPVNAVNTVPTPTANSEPATENGQSDFWGTNYDDYRRETRPVPEGSPMTANAIKAIAPYLISGNKGDLLGRHGTFYLNLVEPATVVLDAFGGAAIYTHFLSQQGNLPAGSTWNEWEYSRSITNRQIKDAPAAVVRELISLRTSFDTAFPVTEIQPTYEATMEQRRKIHTWINQTLEDYLPTQPRDAMGRFPLPDTPRTAALYLFLQNNMAENRVVDFDLDAEGKPRTFTGGKLNGKDDFAFIYWDNPSSSMKHNRPSRVWGADMPTLIRDASRRFTEATIRQGDGWQLAADAPAGALVFVDTSHFPTDEQTAAGAAVMNYGNTTLGDANPALWFQKFEKYLLPKGQDVRYVVTNNFNGRVVDQLEKAGWTVLRTFRGSPKKPSHEFIALSPAAVADLRLPAAPERRYGPGGTPLGDSDGPLQTQSGGAAQSERGLSAGESRQAGKRDPQSGLYTPALDATLAGGPGWDRVTSARVAAELDADRRPGDDPLETSPEVALMDLEDEIAASADNEVNPVNDVLPAAPRRHPATGQKPLKALAASNRRVEYVEPGFYSALAEAIRAKMPARGTPAQILGILKNAGLKMEEIKWTGIKNWLEAQAQDGPITQQQVLDYLATEGSVKFTVTRLNNINADEDAEQSRLHERYRELTDQMADLRRQREEGILTPSEASRELSRISAERSTLDDRLNDLKRRIESDQTRNTQWTLPGGTNPQEVVVTWNQRFPRERFEVRPHEAGYAIYDTQTSQFVSKPYPEEWIATQEMYQRDIFAIESGEQKRLPAPSPNLDTDRTHYGDLDALAWYRTTDRTNAAGNGLLVEEFQSKWHQMGREKGYRDTMQTTPGVFGSTVPATMDEASKVPDAPYRTTWPLMLFKRALRHAVESGKDWIGWTNGDTQADRYDLSKRVSRIDARKYDATRYELAVLDTNGLEIRLPKEAFTAEELPEVVGKELAERIVQDLRFANPSRVTNYTGLDLRVGGQGMRKFYDDILVKEFGKYAKQLGGGAVESSSIDTEPQEMVDIPRNPTNGPAFVRFEATNNTIHGIEPGGRRILVSTVGGTGRLADMAAQIASQKAQEYNTKLDSKRTPIHLIRITPAMREAVTAGQALFAADRSTKLSPADAIRAIFPHANDPSKWTHADEPGSGSPDLRQRESLAHDFAGGSAPRPNRAFTEERITRDGQSQRAELGRLLAQSEVDEASALQLTSLLDHGGEHTVYVSPDARHVVKLTKPGLYGYVPTEDVAPGVTGDLRRIKLRRATPAEYLLRLALFSRLTGISWQPHGVEFSDEATDSTVIVSTQPFIPSAIDAAGNTIPVTQAQVDAYMASIGFQPVEETTGTVFRDTRMQGQTYWHPGEQILAADARPANFKLTPGNQVVPLDLMLAHYPLAASDRQHYSRAIEATGLAPAISVKGKAYTGRAGMTHGSILGDYVWRNVFTPQQRRDDPNQDNAVNFAYDPWMDTPGSGFDDFGFLDTRSGKFLNREEAYTLLKQRGFSTPPGSYSTTNESLDSYDLFNSQPVNPVNPVTEVTLPAAQRVAAAASQTDPNPSDAQKVDLHGLRISIENPAGSVRSGTDAAGKPWSITLPHHYGYILGSEGRDGDHVDVFIGPNPDSQLVLIINQRKLGNGHFDEHKIMLGFNTPAEAARGYMASYTKGWQGLQSAVPTTIPVLKHWITTHDTTQPVTKEQLEKLAKTVPLPSSPHDQSPVTEVNPVNPVPLAASSRLLDIAGRATAITGTAITRSASAVATGTERTLQVANTLTEALGIQQPLATFGSNNLDKKIAAQLDKLAGPKIRSAKTAVETWLDKPDGLAPSIKGLVDQILPTALLPREWLALHHEMQRKTAYGQETANDLIRALSGNPRLSDLAYPKEFAENPAARAKLFDAMEGRIPMSTLPPAMQRLGQRLRDLLRQTGAELVRQGLMNPDTFEELQSNGWMPRYTEDEARESAGSFLAAFKLGVRDLLQQRSTAYHIVDTTRKDKTGQFVTVSRDEGGKRNRWRFRDAASRDAFYHQLIRQHALAALQEDNKHPHTKTLLDALDAKTRREVRADIKKLTLTEMELTAKVSPAVARLIKSALHYQADRFLPKDPFEPAKLVKDPVYAVARYVLGQTHNASTMELLRKTAAHPEWVSDVSLTGFTAIPDASRFGPLAGKHVRKDIAAQILDLVDVPNAGLQFYDAILRKWKAGKLVWNPGSHIRDAVGNTMFAYLAGSSIWNPGNWPYYQQAIAALRTGGKDFAELIEQQVIGGDAYTGLVKERLKGLLPDPKTAEGYNPGFVQRLLFGFGASLHGSHEFLASLRRLPDDLFKSAAYFKAKAELAQQGTENSEQRTRAAEHVRKWFPYYDRLGQSGTTRAVGRFVNPFVSFFRESTRILGTAVAERPLALTASLAFPAIITALSAMALGLDDDDMEQIQKDMAGKGKLFATDTPLFSMLLPFRSAQGAVQQFDISAIMPFADLLGTRVAVTDATEDPWNRFWRGIVAGGPVLSLIDAWRHNEDAFTRRPIAEFGMTPLEKLEAYTKHAAGVALPPLAPGGTAFGTLTRAGDRSTNKTLETYDPAQAVVRAVVGLNVKNATPDLYRLADDWRKAHGYEVTEGMDYGSTTPASRARKALFAQLAQDEPNLTAISNILKRLADMGHPVRTEQDINRLLFYRDPLKLIGGNKARGITPADAQAQFRASLQGEARAALENALQEFQRIKQRAPSLIRRAASSS